jgi:hypothetical protein
MNGRFNGSGENAADWVKHICGSSLSLAPTRSTMMSFTCWNRSSTGAELAARHPGRDEIVES